VSSGAAVAALMTEQYDCNPSSTVTAEASVAGSLRVLDLCCCPGLKLCAIADKILRQELRGIVVGVDVSEQRMAVCKRILLKYQVQSTIHEPSTDIPVRIRLYCNDGTALASMRSNDCKLVFDSVVAFQDDAVRSGKRKRMNKSSLAREKKRLQETSALDRPAASGQDSSPDTTRGTWQLFDRVLVDAECSTDGSTVHVQKRLAKELQQHQKMAQSQIDSSTLSTFRWNEENRDELVALQRKLSSTGFQLLRQGGVMVYSTCSLEEDQNEGVVRWLLGEYPCAKIIPVDFSCHLKREGTIPGTVQFLPNMDPVQQSVDPGQLCGGGFFLAKIFKS
jgi:16S rRNA C967 or C1407 C5-methylase (RsmB/RsmF family)